MFGDFIAEIQKWLADLEMQARNPEVAKWMCFTFYGFASAIVAILLLLFYLRRSHRWHAKYIEIKKNTSTVSQWHTGINSQQQMALEQLTAENNQLKQTLRQQAIDQVSLKNDVERFSQENFLLKKQIESQEEKSVVAENNELKQILFETQNALSSLQSDNLSLNLQIQNLKPKRQTVSDKQDVPNNYISYDANAIQNLKNIACQLKVENCQLKGKLRLCHLTPEEIEHEIKQKVQVSIEAEQTLRFTKYQENEVKREQKLMSNLKTWYLPKHTLMNTLEEEAFRLVCLHLPRPEQSKYSNYYVLPQVRLNSFIDLSKYGEAYYKKDKRFFDCILSNITSKSVDLLICEKKFRDGQIVNFLPRLAIEVDGPYHRDGLHPNVEKNDYFKNLLFQKLNFPLKRIPADDVSDIHEEDVKRILNIYL